MTNNITSIAIVGGGTAGWMTAAALAKVIGASCKITLVESEQIGTVGVGEATIPPIGAYNAMLGMNINEILRVTQGTFKLGIEFLNWGKVGDRYLHPFGVYGRSFNNIAFHHYWQKAYNLGLSPGLEAYSMNAVAARHNKFMRPVQVKSSPLSTIGHAFHFDASLYAKYLGKFSMDLGVERVEGLVQGVEQDPDTGFITKLRISDDRTIEADFFVDCTGFRGLLIEETLKTGYDDWTHYLPCNSALAVPTKASRPILPYTKAIAHAFGWQWRIPLQHRTGNGIVYSDKFIDDATSADTLLSNLDADPLAEPRQLRFTTGKRRKLWNKNVLSVGLSSGFMEPLESTSIHLIQTTVAKFLGLFPKKTDFEAESNRFNKLMDSDFFAIRDFLILHYKATSRTDSEFWNYCRTMPIPDSLQDKIDLYQSSAGLYRDNNELFSEPSWLSVLHGQGIKAKGYNPIVDMMSDEQLEAELLNIRQVISECAKVMPSHEDYLRENCEMDATKLQG